MRHKIGIEVPISDMDDHVRTRSKNGAVVLPTGPESEKGILGMATLFLTDSLALPGDTQYLEVSTESISINNNIRRSDGFIHLPVAEGPEVKGFILDRRNAFNDHEVTFWGEAASQHFPKVGVCRERHQIAHDADVESLVEEFFDGHLDNLDERTRFFSVSSAHTLGEDCFSQGDIEEPNGSKLHLLEVAYVAGAIALDRVSEEGRELSCWSMPT
jgi:hypothetical protein